jgi:hypothetical protein
MKLDALRKLIREEMRTVIQEELKEILTDAVKIASTPEAKPLSSISHTVNSHIKESSIPKPNTYKRDITFTGNPLLDILNETAQEGEWRSLNGDGYSASDAVGWAGGMPGGQTQVVSSVDEMLSKNKHAQDISQVSIDAVPDFTGLMSKLKENGSI